MEPLFELVEDNQDFGSRTAIPAAAHRRHCRWQVQILRHMWAALSHGLQESRLGVERSRLDVGSDNSVGKVGNDSGLQKRALAAAARSVNQSHPERAFRIGLVQSRLPESDAFGKSVTVARTRQ